MGVRRSAAVALACALLAAACGSNDHQEQQARCPLSHRLVPSCGALFGAVPPQPSYLSLRAVEKALGRRVDLTYRFHDINDVIPDALDRRLLRSGRILHITIDSRDYANADPTTVPWSAVASGRYDEQLRRQAEGLKSVHEPVFLTFDHEPDQPMRQALGTPQDFVAAWRHVHEVFAQAGADNVVWVWVVMGWPPAFDRALAMWPGNRYVDWIGWEAYNQAGCIGRGTPDEKAYTSFAEAALPFLHWIRRHGPSVGMDTAKPMMISEAGSVRYPLDDELTAGWYRQIPQVLRSHPEIKAITLWDHTGATPGCDFRFSTSREVGGAVAGVARARWLTPLAASG